MQRNVRFRNFVLAVLLLAPIVLAAQPETQNAGFTIVTVAPDALQQPMPALTSLERQQFSRGRALFNQVWMAAPSIDEEHDGLGPTYNQPSCSACHLRNGRGQPPASERERMRGALVRLSIPDTRVERRYSPHPAYGEQLNDNAITGVPAEGRALVRWVEQTEYFADGDTIDLRRPVVTFTDLAFGVEGSDWLVSLRVAPQIVGAGLLDAVPEATIEALAALSRPDGISGRINRVEDETTGRVAVGRFGWKANTASLLQQTAAAFSGDLGITSRNYPAENCPPLQDLCARLSTAVLDLADMQLEDIVFYQAAVALPAARSPADPVVMKGQDVFEQAGCEHCHLPTLATGNNTLVPIFANQSFHAYTDLLLHDMGEDLADGRPDHDAGPSEWKTPPLWGLGLIPVVNEHQTLLHDGRARGVLEAIMWHGGEAAEARAHVRALNRSERDALVNFVNSL